MRATLKKFLRVVLTALLSALAVQVYAQPAQQHYPSKPIKILVGVPPGGSTDSLSRLFASWLQQSLGQPTIVDNRPGANTAVAADAVARSAPDGYTLLVTTEAFITVPLLTKVSFDPFKDFEPIGTVAVNRFVMAVHPSSPISSVNDLVAAAKARPGKMNYGSSGNGGASHLGIEKFKMLTGTDIVHVPYRGAGPALTDAIGGQYQISLWTPLAISGHVASGKLRALAVTGPKRSSVLPNVPTFAEAGLPGFDHRSWLSVFAPAGTPKPIIDRLSTEIRKMLASQKMKETLDKQGVEPFVSTPQELTATMHKEMAEIGKLVKAANIKMD
jgi:tripartite-type tricarboxylate transporter receptor subunit TctC